MVTSVRAKLGTIFVGFLLLVAGSVVATFVAVRAQRADALVINLAGRQRMLTQAMTKAVLALAYDPASSHEAELREAADRFDRTLTALLDGGSVPYGGEIVALPPTTDGAIRAQLKAVDELWQELQQELQTVQRAEPETPAFAQAIREVESLSPVILQEMDQAVQLYEAAAERKLARLRGIQAVFFVSALALLVLGYLLIQRTVVNPVTTLEAASRRMARGDLGTPA